MRQLPLIAALAAFSLTLSASGCRKDDKKAEDDTAEQRDPNPKDEFGLTAEDKRWWIEKAARVLHKGQGLNDDAEVSRLATLNYPDIAQELMADDRFIETTLDFNFYYFGLKSDQVTYPKPGDLLSSFANFMRLPHAIEGALAVRDGGNYLGMLSDRTRLFAMPLGPVIEFDDTGLHVAADPRKKRQEAYAATFSAIADLIARVEAVPQVFSQGEFCGLAFDIPSFDLFQAGLPDYLTEALFNSPNRRAVQRDCFRPTIDPKVVVPLLRAYSAEAQAIFAEANTLEPDVYLPQSLTDVREVDLKKLGLEAKRGEFTLGWFWQTLPNSSTNFDRKRANYVLKRFFCDDLTPVNVLLPKNHAEGKHATDPGCQSCHYKLDPMAGFFRYNGEGGKDFSRAENQNPTDPRGPQITFDDFAQKPLKEFVEAWKAPAGAGRTWDIGYIRSTTHPELNTYAAHAKDPTFADLFVMLQQAPEVKQCLVRRLFEYFVGSDQVVDSGYLEHLTQRFIDRTGEESSSAAFKETVASLVTSATFRTKDPVSEQCYDRAPGDATPEAERPPCRVAFILQKNCDTCHKGEGAAGGLDLARWAMQPDGHLGFRHVDADGQPVATTETLRRIEGRLGSLDSELRMPLNREIPVADRDTLILWINKTLEAGR